MDPETDQLAALAYSFFEKECAPRERDWCDQQHVDQEIWNRAGELGLLCMSIPEEFGGGGGTFAHEATMLIEQMRALAPSLGIAVHSSIVAHYVNEYGSHDQKSEWLPKIASGEMVLAIAMTEQDRRRHDDHQDDLEADRVLRRISEDLAERGVDPSTPDVAPCSDEAFLVRLQSVYMRYPA